jgi:hypothetical protein
LITSLGQLSALVQRRWGSWGIFILGLWALVLTLVRLAQLLLLSAVVESGGQADTDQGQIWLVFVLNGLFSLAFAASAYGLWTRQHWGRLLFMGSVVVWSGFYIVTLFLPVAVPATENRSPVTLIINLIPYIIGVIISIWYLNLPHIKALFDLKESTDEQRVE